MLTDHFQLTATVCAPYCPLCTPELIWFALEPRLCYFGFHVACCGANLMGLDLFTALGFSLLDTGGSVILPVTPIIQPLRHIPLALHDGVSAEVQQLLESVIIEPIDASPWVSNLVVTALQCSQSSDRDISRCFPTPGAETSQT